MNKWKIAAGAIVLTVVIATPFLAGEIHYPQNLSPKEVAAFIGSWINYWVLLIKHLMREVMK